MYEGFMHGSNKYKAFISYINSVILEKEVLKLLSIFIFGNNLIIKKIPKMNLLFILLYIFRHFSQFFLVERGE